MMLSLESLLTSFKSNLLIKCKTWCRLFYSVSNIALMMSGRLYFELGKLKIYFFKYPITALIISCFPSWSKTKTTSVNYLANSAC